MQLNSYRFRAVLTLPATSAADECSTDIEFIVRAENQFAALRMARQRMAYVTRVEALVRVPRPHPIPTEEHRPA